jgi:hypothetical protein
MTTLSILCQNVFNCYSECRQVDETTNISLGRLTYYNRNDYAMYYECPSVNDASSNVTVDCRVTLQIVASLVTYDHHLRL